MDPLVLQAQKWVNATYRGVPQYVPCPETGVTGWPVMHSLTRALQHELGLTSLADAFGAATTAAMDAHGPITAQTPNVNMRTIVEAALYCKGYTGGLLNGSYSVLTLAGIALMKDHMGLASTSEALDTKLLKSLLSMDAYVVIWNGDTTVRQVQQWLNRTYISRRGFQVLPCDGIFSRAVQKGLVFALQYSMGMSDTQADGLWGPATASGLKSAVLDVGSTDSGSKHFVRLYKAALLFNGQVGIDWESGTFSSSTADTTKKFQQFCMLPRTGKGDYATWCSLLVSTGDPGRSCTAADCKAPLNQARISTLKGAGVKVIGRYISGGTQKFMAASEAKLIIDNGLGIIPIYQDYNNAPQYFTYEIGASQAQKAITNAQQVGIPNGAIIYFPSDWDATAEDVRACVLPYFRGVRDVFENNKHPYRVGVYAPRNVCSMVSDANLAVSSFVSGMSTGWSGNLGFALPENWSFDQIASTKLAAGTAGEVVIDRDVASGRDPAVRLLSKAVDPNDAFFTWVRWLENRAADWKSAHPATTESAPWLVAEYLRRYKTNAYVGLDFNTLCGEVNSSFINWADVQAGRPDPAALRDPVLGESDIEHFGAVMCASYKQSLNAAPLQPSLHDFGGWAGDLIQVASSYWKQMLPSDEASAYAWGLKWIGGSDYGFGSKDLVADVDAELFWATIQRSPDRTLSSLFEEFYLSDVAAHGKYRQFIDHRFGGVSGAGTAASAALGAATDPGYLAARTALWAKYTGRVFDLDRDAAPGLFRGLARAFVDVVDRLSQS